MLQALLDRMVLLAPDREKALARGFQPELIRDRQYKSCTPLNAFFVDWYHRTYGIEAAVKEGLLVPDRNNQGEYNVQQQILIPNTLIPYRDKGKLLKIRPHKRGFPGQPAMVYRSPDTRAEHQTCIIAESEFKSEASWCFGFPSIGIPGIASMSGKNWDYFARELETTPAKEFVICFDNEIKSNPAFSNFKPDWKKRYDTIVYAYAMAQKILNIGKSCRIATLPANWMVNGKIDIDGALAANKTPEEFAEIVKTAQGPKAFLDAAPIPTKHRGFVTRRVRKFFYEPQIEVKGNAFYLKGQQDKEGEVGESVKLSNCFIKIKNVYEDFNDSNEGVLRDLVIIDEYGVESPPVQIKSAFMATRSRFKEWLMSHGPYLFYGSDVDVTKVWDYIFANDESSNVFLIKQCGYVKDFDMWLFDNVLIKDGTPVFPDEAGVFWADETGFKLHAPADDYALPALVTDATKFPKEFIKKVEALLDYETPGLTKAIFSWFLAVLFSEAIYTELGLFPLLFLYGPSKNGKTTLIKWFSELLGLHRSYKSLSMSSVVGVTRMLDYYGSLSFVIDDWRNEPKSKTFIPLLLGVYNRQTGVKGTRNKFEVVQSRVRAALALAGEELIGDNAVFSRCAAFYIPKLKFEEIPKELEEESTSLSALTYSLLTSDYSAKASLVIKNIPAFMDQFRSLCPSADARTIMNYAILAASYTAVMGPDESLIDGLAKMLGKMSNEVLFGDRIHKFFSDFTSLVAEGAVKPHCFEIQGNVLYLFLKGITDAVNRYHNRQGVGDDDKLLVDYFSRLPYFVGYRNRRMRGDRGAGWMIALDCTKMPPEVYEYAKGLDYEGELSPKTDLAVP